MPDLYNIICGIPDDGQVWITSLSPTIEFRWDGSACILSQIRPDRPCHPVWVGPGGASQVKIMAGPVINNIADPDLCGAALAAASSIVGQVSRTWFNHPDRVRATARDRVSESLQGILGLSVPRVIRCRPQGVEDLLAAIGGGALAYPLLVRPVGSQRGRGLVRMNGEEDARSFMRDLFDGGELYLSPFIDFADADGLYRKHRVAMIGGQPFLNSLVTGAHWKVHAGSRIWTEATINAEQAALDNFALDLGARLAPRLEEIYRRLGLDYFGMDFAMRPDGTMLLFEANAAMEILGPSKLEPDIWARSEQAIRAALLALLDQPRRWVDTNAEA